MARKFLYLIAILIALTIAGLFILRIWANELSEFVFVPSVEFTEQKPLEVNAYNDPEMWFSRPGIGISDPARWQPNFVKPEVEGTAPPVSTPTQAAAPAPPPFAVFFVHPTSFLESGQWNATLEDESSQTLGRLVIKGMASPFNKASEIWAPRYRQAALGSFLTDDPKAEQALTAAYSDVEQAFEFFLESVAPDTPIVLAGHSQGSVHLLRLLHSRIAGSEAQARIAMVYAIGWPISIKHDLPSLGLPACATPDQAGCVVSWLSFAEPAEPGQMLKRYTTSPGFDGQPRGGSPMLCINPITGMLGGEAPARDNLGTLIPEPDLSSGELTAGIVPARCDERGLLMIGEPPDMGQAVLPGNNYHIYDIPLFWKNLQMDVLRRVQAWTRNH